jgi:hypothetical protein
MASILARLRVKTGAEGAFEGLVRPSPRHHCLGPTVATAPATALPSWWADVRGSR